ncbi:MAG: ABC transporter permease [Deltaproteobacteria bacterium]|nr:ABC transporter permease [Deltaproteobacteria bacterium]MDQ3300456.1 ABC transporter permease [Myxococcota bacterium]
MSGPADDEPTQVRPGAAPEAGASKPPVVAPPALGDDLNTSLTGEERPRKPPLGDSLGGAVWAGVKDAGAPIHRFLEMVGGHLILTARALSWLPRRPYRPKNYLDALEYIGFASLPIVLLVGVFTGAVLSLQSVAAFRQFGLESFAGGTTGKALSIELAPVMTALMLAGRAGAGIATELGTMRISEQIDALESMAVNPIQFLVLPRLIASMIVTPILSLLFFVVGMGGAYIVAVLLEGVDQGQWVANLREIVLLTDVLQGLIKSVFFGFMVTLIGCYQGFNATGGGRGVGMGTTRAVVMGSVTVLVMDYFLTDILLTILGTGKGGL